MRLIDADDLNWWDDLYMKGVNNSGVWVRYKDCREFIDSAPTIELPSWIPFVMREMTEEEKETYPDLCFMFDCQIPEDGQEVLVSKWGYVFVDVFSNDGSDGCGFEGCDEIEDGMAWMPLPKPHKEGE